MTAANTVRNAEQERSRTKVLIVLRVGVCFRISSTQARPTQFFQLFTEKGTRVPTGSVLALAASTKFPITESASELVARQNLHFNATRLIEFYCGVPRRCVGNALRFTVFLLFSPFRHAKLVVPKLVRVILSMPIGSA